MSVSGPAVSRDRATRGHQGRLYRYGECGFSRGSLRPLSAKSHWNMRPAGRAPLAVEGDCTPSSPAEEQEEERERERE